MNVLRSIRFMIFSYAPLHMGTQSYACISILDFVFFFILQLNTSFSYNAGVVCFLLNNCLNVVTFESLSPSCFVTYRKQTYSTPLYSGSLFCTSLYIKLRVHKQLCVYTYIGAVVFVYLSLLLMEQNFRFVLFLSCSSI